QKSAFKDLVSGVKVRSIGTRLIFDIEYKSECDETNSRKFATILQQLIDNPTAPKPFNRKYYFDRYFPTEEELESYVGKLEVRLKSTPSIDGKPEPQKSIRISPKDDDFESGFHAPTKLEGFPVPSLTSAQKEFIQ